MAVRAHVCITTHTADRLGPTLAGIALQLHAPASVVVSVDGADAAIGALLDGLWPRLAAGVRAQGVRPPALLLTERAHAGCAQPNQARNNALRALEAHTELGDDDLIVGLDGDIVLHPSALGVHADRARAGADVVSAFRINLDASASAEVGRALAGGEAAGDSPEGRRGVGDAVEVGAMLDGLATARERALLATRAGRAARQLVLRRSGLTALVKAHKPKLITAHHGVRVRALRSINGYDEAYSGYGYEDDDLARRLHAAKVFRWSVAIEDALAFHLHHATRAPSRPTDAPGYARFSAAGWTLTAAAGWRTPGAQAEVRTRVIEG